MNQPEITNTKNILLTPRDLNALLEVSRHKMLTSMQLAKLCYPDISYETSRKRLRRLHQANILGSTNLNDVKTRGRPDLIYFLTPTGKKHIEPYIKKSLINFGLKNIYQRDIFIKIADIRLALIEANKVGIIQNVQFYDYKEYINKNPNYICDTKITCDAIVTFTQKSNKSYIIALKCDTGNLRLNKHFKPLFEYFSINNLNAWFICPSWDRINQLINDCFPKLSSGNQGYSNILFTTINEFTDKQIKQSILKKFTGELTNFKYSYLV